MAKRMITFDTTEIVAMVEIPGDGEFKKAQTRIMSMTYDKFSKISFVPCTERKLFKAVPSEKIVIKLKAMRQPIEFTKLKNKEFYEEYKEGFREFARKNRIDLVDETVAK